MSRADVYKITSPAREVADRRFSLQQPPSTDCANHVTVQPSRVPEPWDECLPTMLREQRGVYSHMITDHYHYFHSGGEGYNTIYSSWEFLRGQEGDTWRPLVEEPPKPDGARGLEGPCRWGYWRNQTYAPME